MWRSYIKTRNHTLYFLLRRRLRDSNFYCFFFLCTQIFFVFSSSSMQCWPLFGVSPCRCASSHLGPLHLLWHWCLLKPRLATSCLREATHAFLFGWLRPTDVVVYRCVCIWFSSCLSAPCAEWAHLAGFLPPSTCRQVCGAGVRSASRAWKVCRGSQTHPVMRAIRGRRLVKQFSAVGYAVR